MKTLLLCLLLTSCASTKVYDQAGKVKFSTQADGSALVYHDKQGDYLAMGTFGHSATTNAAGQSAIGIAGSVANVATKALLTSKRHSVTPSGGR
jgi:hypothetical protein